MARQVRNPAATPIVECTGLSENTKRPSGTRAWNSTATSTIAACCHAAELVTLTEMLAAVSTVTPARTAWVSGSTTASTVTDRHHDLPHRSTPGQMKLALANGPAATNNASRNERMMPM